MNPADDVVAMLVDAAQLWGGGGEIIVLLFMLSYFYETVSHESLFPNPLREMIQVMLDRTCVV